MPNIDERVVQMTFDNKQFEKGVSTSLKTLEDLKKALEFDKVEKSLSNIESAFNNVDFSGMSNAIDAIANKFRPLGVLGVTVMQRISNAAIDAGKKVADAFLGFSDMSAGQGKYETQTKAVQTITNATGKSVEEVEKVLEKLQDYTDETSYDFAEMVASIGKFTSVGIELERAEKAMEGIANEAAKSGAGKAEANRAMYNFAQALSAGAVKLQDWKSIENANMATKEFKETLIQTAIELGVLVDKGDNVGSIVTTNQEKLAKAEKALAKAQKSTKDKNEKVAEAQAKIAAATKETTVNYQNFNQTLSEGWLTSDVLIATLEKYSARGTEFGDAAYYAAQKALTWSDAMDAVKDAVSSGWMESYKQIFGNLDEAMELWTNVANALVEYTDIFTSWRNDVLKAWHEQGGYNDMIEAASNLWQTFMNIVKGVGKVLAEVFPILDTTNATEFLKNATKSLKETSASILEMFGLYEEVVEEEEEAADKAEDAAEATEKIADNAESAADAMSDLSDETKKTAKQLGNVETGLKRGVRSESVKQMQEQLMEFGIRLDKYGADGIFGPETEAAVKELQRTIGVPETGIFDEMTKAALETEDAMRKLQERANRGLRLGDTGNDVKKLQKELNKYLDDSEKLVVDGIMGPKTEAAVKKVQKMVGVEQTGAWDKVTQAAVKASKLTLFNMKKLSHELKRGDVSDSVKELQEELIKTGYLTDQSVADGIYGPKTEEAVKALQRELGVKETGVWDHASFVALNSARRIKKANSELTDEAEKAAKANEDASESASKSTSHTTTAMMRLQNIVKGWASALKIAAKFGGAVVQIGSNILGMFKPLIDVGIRFGSVFGVMFQNLADDLDKDDAYGKFVTNVTNAFGPFGQFIENIAGSLGKFLDAYDEFLESTGKRNTFENFFKYLQQSYPVLAGIIEVFKTAGKIIGSVVGWIGDKLGKFFDLFSTEEFQNGKAVVLDLISKKFEALRAVIEKFKKEHPEITIENFGKKLSELGGWVLGKFGSAVSFIKDKFGGLIEVIQTFIASHPELSLSNIFNKIVDFGKKIGSGLSVLFGSEQQSESGTFFDELKTRFKAFEPVLEWFKGIKDRIIQYWNDIFGINTTETGEKKSFVDTIKEKLSGLEGVVDWIISIKDKIVAAWNQLIGAGEGAGVDIAKNSGITAVTDAISSVTKDGGFISVADKLKEFGMFLIDHWPEIALGVTGISFAYGLVNAIKVARNLSKGFNNIAGALKKKLGKDDPKDTIGTTALKIAGAILIVAGAVALLANIDANKAWEGIKPFLTILGAMAVAVIAINKLSGEDADGGKQALMLAGAIGIIAASVWLLCKTISTYDKPTIDLAMQIIMAMLISLGTIAILIGATSQGDGVQLKGFLAMCAGVLVLAIAFKKVLKLISNDKYFARWGWAFLIIEGMLGTLGLIAWAVSRESSSSGNVVFKGFLAMCAGVYVLAVAFGKMLKIITKSGATQGELGQALVAIEIMVFSLGTIAFLISKFTKGDTSGMKGFLSMCAGVYALVLAYKRIVDVIHNSGATQGQLGQALAAIEIMLGTLGLISLWLSRSSNRGKVKIVGMIATVASLLLMVNIFGRVVKIITSNKKTVVRQAFATIAIMLAGIALITGLMGKYAENFKIAPMITMFVGLAAVIGAFGFVLTKIKDVDPLQMVAFSGSLALALAAFSIACVQIGKGGFGNGGNAGAMLKGALALAGSITILVAAIAIIIGGLGKLDQVPAFEGAFERGSQMLLSVASALKNFKENGLLELGAAIGILIVLARIESVIQSSGGTIILGALGISVALIILVAAIAIIVGGLGYLDEQWNGGLSKAIEHGGEVLAAIGGAIKAFVDSFKSNITDDIEAFSDAMSDLMTTVDGISSDQDLDADIAKALEIANKMKSFFEQIGNYDVNLSGIEGYNTAAEALSSDIGTFGTKIGEFKAGVSGLDADNTIDADTDKAIEIAKYIKENFFDVIGGEGYLPDGTNLKAYNEKISSIIDLVGQFGTNMGLYHSGVSGFNTPTIQQDTQAAIDAASEVARFMEEVGSLDIETKLGGILGWFQGDTKQDTVADYVVKLAESITSSKDKFAELGSTTIVTDVTAAITAFKEIAKFLTFLSAESLIVNPETVTNIGWGEGLVVDKLETLLNKFVTMGNYIHDFSTKVEGIDIGNTAALIQSVVSFLQLASTGINNAIAGIDDMSNDSSLGNKMGEIISNMAASLDAHKEDFKTSGMNFDLGLAEGVTEYAENPVTAIGNVAQRMINKVNEVLDEHSPSEEAITQGAYYVLGLVQGVEDNAGEAEKATENAANGMLDGVAKVIGGKAGEIPILSAFVNEDAIKQGLNDVVGIAEEKLGTGSALSKLLSGSELSADGIKQIGDTLSGFISGDLSFDNLFDTKNSESVINQVLKTFTEGMEGIPNFEELLNSDGIESQISEVFGNATSYADDFKQNYSLDKLLQGDLKYGSTGESVKQMQEWLQSLGYSLDKFGADGIFGPETQAAVNAFKKDAGLTMDGVFDSQAYQKITEALGGDQAASSYTEVGNKISECVSTGFASGDVKAIEEFVSSILAKIQSYETDFKEAGKNFALGLGEGVYFKAYFAIQSAKYVAQQMVTAVKNAFQTASPSKVMTQVGKYFSEGLAIGTKEEGITAVKSSKDVAEEMIKTTKETLKPLSSILLEDIDDNPVISPVVDMTNVRDAAAAMGGYFRSPGLSANMYTSTSGSIAQVVAANMRRSPKDYGRDDSGNTSASGNYSRGKDYAGFANDIMDKFDLLAEKITGMKVVLDTGEFVGATSTAYDKQFGRMTGRRERGN